MSNPTIGSLFSGYGGLDMGVQSVTGGRVSWVSDVEPGPCAILDAHHPDIPNLGDVTAIDWKSVEPVDVICGGSPCFVAGTPVLTHDGLRPIEDVQVGDLVWTHAARWQRVTHTMRRTSETVQFRSGFYCTPEHRLWLRAPQQRWNKTIRQYRRHLDAPEWVEAKDAHNLFAASPVSVTHEGVSKPDTLTWWQIGRFVADGYVNKQVNVYIGKGKESDADNFPGWTHHQQKTALCLTMPKSAAERDWLTEHFGKLAHGKTIPAFLLAETEENRRAFLDGYWSGDGWKPEGRKFTKSTSVSACLTTGIELLAKSLGYTCTVSQCQVAPTTVIEGRTVNQRPWWMVRATPDDGRFTETDADWNWFKLRRAPKAGEVTTVYDLTVERDHSFIAAGIVVHNCQDLSMAGRRAGMRPGTRSGLWESMMTAITTIRPRLVVWENVLGALSADAFTLCDLESESRHLGSSGQRHPLLRALGRVLGDLAGAGFDAQWISLRASDVGACHRRTRVFLIAYPQGDPWRSDEWWQPAAGETQGGRARADARGSDRAPVSHLLPTPTQRDFKDHRIARNPRRPDDIDTLSRALTLLPTPKASDGAHGGPNQRGSKGDLTVASAIALLPTPIAERPDGHRSANFADGHTTFRDVIDRDRWGEYAQAIARWEEVTGRPVPEPTEQGRTALRLSARFVEWMMGLPDGWVTDVDISRTAQLRALGNGVVPQQAATAIRTMLTNIDAMEEAA